MTETSKQRRWLVLLYPDHCILIRIVWPVATDFILFILFMGYGYGLFRIAWRGASLHAEPTGGVSTYGKDGFFAGSFLCLSALTDLAIIFDFNITGGKQAPGMIVIFQMTLLPLIAAAIVSAGRTTVSEMITGKKRPESVVKSSGEFEAIYRRLETSP